MPKDRDRAVNPATAHLKSQKAAALKKSKAQLSAQRNERLSKRNPDRLQRQIDELKALQEAQGGTLRPREKQELEKLEKDVKSIHKARGGDAAVTAAGVAGQEGGRGRDYDGGERGGRNHINGRGAGGSSVLGKRRHDEYRISQRQHDAGMESDATDPDVRDIPMPRDTPPPIPPRQHRGPRRPPHAHDAAAGTGANSIALPPGSAGARTFELPPKPVVIAQTTYESAPQIRDLRKEATAKFVPGIVAARLKAGKSGNVGGRYLEPEEVDRLEASGYLGGSSGLRRSSGVGDAGAGGKMGARSLEEEEAAFERELRETEEVQDWDRDGLVQGAMEDAEMAAEEAVKEVEYGLMADGLEDTELGGVGRERQVERQLRHVEMEEVEDEEDEDD